MGSKLVKEGSEAGWFCWQELCRGGNWFTDYIVSTCFRLVKYFGRSIKTWIIYEQPTKVLKHMRKDNSESKILTLKEEAMTIIHSSHCCMQWSFAVSLFLLLCPESKALQVKFWVWTWEPMCRWRLGSVAVICRPGSIICRCFYLNFLYRAEPFHNELLVTFCSIAW